MAQTGYPLIIDTLGKTRDIGYSISIHCNVCNKHTDLDLDRLIDRLGADHGSMDWDLRPHFFCADCRAAERPDRDFNFILGNGNNAYRQAKGS